MALTQQPVPFGRSGIGQFFLGTPASVTQASTKTGEQSDAMSQAIQQALSGLPNPQAGFAPIAQQAREQFQQQTVPSIAERFSSLGSGSQGSSAFGQQLGSAGAGLESNLAAQGAQFGQQQQGLLQQLLGLGLGNQFENLTIPRESGFLEKIFSPSQNQKTGEINAPSIFKLLSMFAGG